MPRKQVVERIAYLTIFGLVAFWILAVFALVFHSMNDGPDHQREAPPPNQPRELIRKSGAKPEFVKRTVVEHKQAEINLPKYLSPLIIFTCKRADYLKQTLTQVLEYMPQSCAIGCPLVISQDGFDEEVDMVVKQFQNRYEGVIPILHFQHEQGGGQRRVDPYRALAVHYGWALKKLFGDGEGGLPGGYPQADRVIILEEDLHISPDFFDYFASTAPILDQDETLLAVSAFNDNGKEGRVKDASRILRSDFFPGLGWMMTRKLWDMELSSKWPDGWWDDWLREPAQRQSRHILRPEVSRTFHFGVKGGASANQFGDKLSSIHLDTEKVDWASQDLSYLKPSRYDQSYFSLVSMAEVATDFNKALDLCKTRDARLEYTSFGQFRQLASQLAIMNDEKAGIPRTAYRGVVEIRPYGENILFLTPPMDQLKTDFHFAN